MLLRIKPLNLQQRLYLYLLPVIMIACLTVAWVFHYEMTKSITAEMKGQMFSLSREAENRVLAYLKTSQSDADFFSTNVGLPDLLSAKGYNAGVEAQRSALDFFSQLQTTKPSYREMYILNTEGKIVLSHADDIFYQAKSDETWLNQLYTDNKNKGPLVEKFLITNTENGRRIATLSRIHDRELRTIGYLVLAQDLRIFADMSRNSPAELVYVDAMNEPLHDTSERNLTLMDLHQASPSLDVYGRDDGTWKIHHATNRFGGAYVFHDASYYFKNLKKIRNQTAGITLGFTAIFSLLVWWLVNQTILRPLHRLSQEAEHVADGTYNESNTTWRQDEIGKLWASILSMANNIKKTNQRIHTLAYYDDLTGLYNKQAFLEHARKFTDPIITQDVAVWVLDLDHFKQINDIHGYHTGNAILKAVGERLSSVIELFATEHAVSRKQFMLSRSAGDEYLIFARLPSAPSNDLARVFTEALREGFTAAITLHDIGQEQTHRVSAFIGWDQGGNSGFEIYEKADMAMHEAKNTGTPTLRFNSTLLERARQNQELSENIKKAIEKNAFTLHYQPKCSISNPSRPMEYEALIRWPTAEGMISPGVFIPFAEDANLIGAIDLWVCKKVISDVAVMEAKGMRGFCVSFNVSACRLSDGHFIQFVRQHVVEANINPAHIQIEITEHSLIHNVEASIEAITSLKAFGISVALDDFGTGHSSLGYLKDLPISTLKIDRCFVKDTDKDLHKKTLLRHIIAIGKSLGLQVVAEGVETASECDVLKELSCDLAQGYFFYRPMPLDDIMRLQSNADAA